MKQRLENMMRQRYCKPSHCTFHLAKICRWRQLRTPKELTGNSERSAIHSLGDTETGIILAGKGPQTQENKRQVEKPIRTSQVGTESSLEGTMETLDHAVALRMKSSHCRGVKTPREEQFPVQMEEVN